MGELVLQKNKPMSYDQSHLQELLKNHKNAYDIGLKQTDYQLQRRTGDPSQKSHDNQKQPRILKTSTPYKNGQKMFDTHLKKNFMDINSFKSIRQDINNDIFQEGYRLAQSNKKEYQYNNRYSHNLSNRNDVTEISRQNINELTRHNINELNNDLIENNSLVVNDIDNLGNMTFQQIKHINQDNNKQNNQDSNKQSSNNNQDQNRQSNSHQDGNHNNRQSSEHKRQTNQEYFRQMKKVEPRESQQQQRINRKLFMDSSIRTSGQYNTSLQARHKITNQKNKFPNDFFTSQQ